jgi:REP element-mobilizing transposase RayT
MKQSYQRHLPHQIPKGLPVFLTWNLKGAMPKEPVERLKHERERLRKEPRKPGETPKQRRVREAKLLFAAADQHLDCATDGPLHLKDPTAAKIVEDAVLFGAEVRYELYAWCVMANHVHVFLTPTWEFEKITKGIKGHSAYKINGLNAAHGRTFWQDESYDHWARDEEEILRIIACIEGNPVAAKLCAQPEDWPWSSARLRIGWQKGTPYRRSGFPA